MISKFDEHGSLTTTQGEFINDLSDALCGHRGERESVIFERVEALLELEWAWKLSQSVKNLDSVVQAMREAIDDIDEVDPYEKEGAS